jgi:phosphoribosylformimino-5-aminoimidazole carboxamide ribotide isomerase
VILSLDFRGDEFLGPANVLADPAGWPDRLIVMDLARVGHASAGPDLKRLESFRKIAGGRELYLAGGLRGPEDFSALRAARATGILAASALHDGRVSAAALAEA